MDNISWREVKEDNQCWSHKGEYLGRCTQIGTTGPAHDLDPFFRFQETGDKVFQGLELKFTKVRCETQDRLALINLHEMSQRPEERSTTKAVRTFRDLNWTKEIASYYDPLPVYNPRAPPTMAVAAAATASVSQNSFTPIVLNNSSGQKIYECPICHNKTGTLVPQDPVKYADMFHHNFNCQNKGKIPKEEPTGGKKYKKKLLTKRKRYSKKRKHSKSKKSSKDISMRDHRDYEKIPKKCTVLNVLLLLLQILRKL